MSSEEIWLGSIVSLSLALFVDLPKKKDSKSSKSSKKKSKKKKKESELMTDNWKYMGALFVFVLGGKLLQNSAFAQTMLTVTFWLYLFWFCDRFNKLKKSDLSG